MLMVVFFSSKEWELWNVEKHKRKKLCSGP